MAGAATVELCNGVNLPRVGLGTFKARGAAVRQAVEAALRCGFRHIDTATIYQNHAEVGAALRASGVERADVCVTSKLSPYEQGEAEATLAVEQTLAALGLDYIDMMLIHWPGVARVPLDSPINRERRLQSWRALERMHAAGTIRAIGVSNFEMRHLEHLLQHATVKPAINQIEVHPRFQQRALRKYCVEQGIQVVAYASYGCGDLFSHPAIVAASREAGLAPAVALLRWALQGGCCVIPKSVSVDRIAEVAPDAVLAATLSGSTMEAFDALDDGHKYCWDPATIKF